ncbi:MAG: Na+/H+ antiporter subunit E [Lachnospiraceae bacterium]|nr:Na+/H+ antiporter subunit E [Lachnospiraceae bacterium]
MFLFVGLFLFWVILNGRMTLEICLFGVVIAGVLTWFSRKFIRDGQVKRHTVRYYQLLVQYGFLLVVEIVKANICVMKLAFSRRLNFQPALVSFETPLKDEALQVMLANSITITPGTMTVLLEDGRFVVHCLDQDLGVGIDRCSFVRLLQQMEEADKAEGGQKNGITE